MKRSDLEATLRQMFYDGELFSPKFDMYSDSGRKEAARYFADKLGAASKPEAGKKVSY